MDRELDLSLLRTFVVVATTGSFTTASQRLLRTQPAISQRMKRLEEMVGLPLVVRSPEGVALTGHGAVLLGYAKRMLSLNDEAISRMGASAVGEVIRLGLCEEYPAVRLELVLGRLAAAHPDAGVAIDVRLGKELVVAFDKGQYDVIVTQGLASETSNAARRVPLVWVCGTRWNVPADGVLPLVMFPEGSLYRHMVTEALLAAQLSWRVVCTSTSWRSLRSAVEAGMGISVATADAVDGELRTVERGISLPTLPEAVILVHTLKESSPPARRLAQLLCDEIGGYDVGRAAMHPTGN